MKENVLDVLIYLYESAIFEDDDAGPDQETLISELSQAGFDHASIDLAFDWLENLAALCEKYPTDQLDMDPVAVRHYSALELTHIDTEARGLLLKLEQCGVLNKISREMVIDQLMALEYEDIEPDHVRWVTLLVLDSCMEGGGVNELTESLVLDGLQSFAH